MVAVIDAIMAVWPIILIIVIAVLYSVEYIQNLISLKNHRRLLEKRWQETIEKTVDKRSEVCPSHPFGDSDKGILVGTGPCTTNERQ